jgi:hypothetical protein
MATYIHPDICLGHCLSNGNGSRRTSPPACHASPLLIVLDDTLPVACSHTDSWYCSRHSGVFSRSQTQGTAVL